MLNRILAGLKGQQAEVAACAYLQQQGLKLVAKNYRSKAGEIDLIMRDERYLIFVEVRYREQHHYGSGVESITADKCKKLLKTAEYYLLQHRLVDKVPCRFDVIAISRQAQITWIKDAFSYDRIR